MMQYCKSIAFSDCLKRVTTEAKNHLQNNPLKSQKWDSTTIGSRFWTGTDT